MAIEGDWQTFTQPVVARLRLTARVGLVSTFTPEAALCLAELTERMALNLDEAGHPVNVAAQDEQPGKLRDA